MIRITLFCGMNGGHEGYGNRKEINVTNIVTYEKDFGDGSYYKIVCSNDETGSTYINGSYFVRWSMAKQILRAKFVFSADGTSFSAPCGIIMIKSGVQ